MDMRRINANFKQCGIECRDNRQSINNAGLNLAQNKERLCRQII